MLLRLIINNFLSFYDPFEFNMFPNPKREFFKLKPERVIPLLKKLASAEIMANKVEKMFNGSVSVAEKEAVKQFHRPMLDFKEMAESAIFYA